MTGDPRKHLGNHGEDLAAAWYAERGWDVLARNWHCREGELDLVVRKDEVVAFVEVKARASARWGSPLEAVTPAKQRKIRTSAMRWLQAEGVRSPELRFDVVAVTAGRITDVLEGCF